MRQVINEKAQNESRFDGFFSELHPDHALVLTERGISEAQAAARAYHSTIEKRHLESLGFNRSQAATAATHRPVLVIPLHRPDGEIENYQIRPNRPREVKRVGKKTRILKYELPANTSTVIVCPPTERQRESLKAAGVPLFITESALKADANLSIGLLTVGILGIDGWRAKNAYDGVTAHPAWEEINLARDIFYIPDSDSSESKKVRRAIRRFVKWLEFKHATVKVIWLPPKADGSKCGLDDFIAERKTCGLTNEEIRRDLLHYATDEIPGEDAFDSNEPSFNPTDLGNAERFIHQHKDKVRFCHKWKKWLVWNGQRWAIDDTAAIYRMAQQTARSIYAEAGRQLDEEKRQALSQWAVMSERAQRIEAIVNLASKQEAVAVLPDDLDKDLFLLTVNNGTLDLRTGILRAHNRADLITKLAPVDYDPNAEMPLVKEFLLEIMDSSGEMISFIQRMLGYSLTGDTREQILPICYGVGANGKTTLLGMFQEMLGDYATAASTGMLMVKRNESIACDLAVLKGARFVTASEVEDGQRFAESKVKELTGGDLITARHLYGDPFTFKPNFKIWLCVNHKPTIRGTDMGIWRRVQLIPFTVVIPKERQDKGLPLKLRQELPGLLAWAVAGCLEWQKNGLGVPNAVEQATRGYKDEMDVLGQFISERCTVNESMSTQSSQFYAAWKKWCEANGETERSNKWLTQRMEEKGFVTKRRKNGMRVFGIGVKSEDDTDD